MKRFVFLCLLLVGMIATVNASPPGIDTHNQFTAVQVLDESGIVIVAVEFACVPETVCIDTSQPGYIVYDQQSETIYLDPEVNTPVDLARSRLTCANLDLLSTKNISPGNNLLVTPRSRAWVMNENRRSCWSVNSFHDGDFYKA